MTKKLLLSAAFVAVVGVASSFAQVCTPDVSCITPSSADYGICPDSATGIASGMVGVPYSQVMSMKVPPTAAHWGQPTAQIDSLVITNIAGLAAGQTVAYSTGSPSFPGGTVDCLKISGTPTAACNNVVDVTIVPHVFLFGNHFASTPVHMKQYKMVIVPTGIETMDLNKFDVDQNSPNPFAEKTDIRFNTVTPGNIDFKVYNMVGAVVYNSNFKSEKGMNTITLAANTFAPGVYMYSVSNGEKTITKRMVVLNK